MPSGEKSSGNQKTLSGPLRQLYTKCYKAFMDNPVLLVPALLSAALSVLVKQVPLTGPVTSFIVSILLLFLYLAISCGLLGMAHKSLVTGKTKLSDFSETIEKHYVRFLLASLVVGGLGLLVALPLLVSIASVAGYISMPFVLSTVLVILGIPILIAFAFLISFYSMAIVVDSQKPVESIKTSYMFVRKNTWGIIVLSLSLILVFVLVLLPIGIITSIAGKATLSDILLAPFSVFFELLYMSLYLEKKAK